MLRAERLRIEIRAKIGKNNKTFPNYVQGPSSFVLGSNKIPKYLMLGTFNYIPFRSVFIRFSLSH